MFRFYSGKELSRTLVKEDQEGKATDHKFGRFSEEKSGALIGLLFEIVRFHN